MNPMGDIRPATPDDADELARLQAEYHAERYGPSGLDRYRDDFSRFAHDSLSAGWTAWVSETDTGLDGAVWCHHDLDRPEHERDWVAVTRLKVDPLADEPAVATRLLDHLIAWAREAGFRKVVAWPSPEQSAMFVERGFLPDTGDAFVLTFSEEPG